MRECKIGVGGCGGKLYKTFLDYAKDLVGPVVESPLVLEEELVKKKEGKEDWNSNLEDWKSLFKGLWLDLDSDDVNGLKPVEKREDDYYGGYYYLYNKEDVLTDELKEKMINIIGYQLDAPGFIHRPELQMIAFANQEINMGICGKISEKIGTDLDSLFFFVGLGGGTGTGVIGNLTKYIEEKTRTMKASFVLGVLTGKHDHRKFRVQAKFHRRSFNAMWALSDLLAGKKVNCVILMDNDKISEIGEVKEGIRKLGEEQAEYVLDRYIIKSILPWLGKGEMGQMDGKKDQIDESDLKMKMAASEFTPIFVPCYWHGKMTLEELIKNAIEKGKLADCDHEAADAAYVFTRGFTDKNEIIIKNVKAGLKEKHVTVKGVEGGMTRKIGGNPKDKEVLILLKNPGIKELLSERIEAAIDFIVLIEVIERITNEDLQVDTANWETIGTSLKEQIERDVEGKELLKRIEAKIKEYLDKSEDWEQEVMNVIVEAWEFLQAGERFKFTKEAKNGERRFIKDFINELGSVRKRIENGEREIFKENVRIKLGCSFSMDARYSEELDHQFQKMPGVGMAFKKVVDTKTLKNLKEIFLKEEGLKLSEIVTVTKEKEDEWEITDEEKKFIVRKEDGKLNVYNSVGSSIFSREEDGLSKERLLDLLKDDEDVKREIKNILNLNLNSSTI